MVENHSDNINGQSGENIGRRSMLKTAGAFGLATIGLSSQIDNVGAVTVGEGYNFKSTDTASHANGYSVTGFNRKPTIGASGWDYWTVPLGINSNATTEQNDEIYNDFIYDSLINVSYDPEDLVDLYTLYDDETNIFTGASRPTYDENELEVPSAAEPAIEYARNELLSYVPYSDQVMSVAQALNYFIVTLSNKEDGDRHDKKEFDWAGKAYDVSYWSKYEVKLPIGGTTILEVDDYSNEGMATDYELHTNTDVLIDVPNYEPESLNTKSDSELQSKGISRVSTTEMKHSLSQTGVAQQAVDRIESEYIYIQNTDSKRVKKEKQYNQS